MHIKLNNISCAYPNKDKIFTNLNFSVSDKKAGLVGNNGTGKSTLLHLIAGKIIPDEGNILLKGKIVLHPQDFSQYNNMTVAEVLSVKDKLNSLEKILQGNANEQDYEILNEEWDLLERIEKMFSEAKFENIALERNFSTLSGGEKSRLLFASLLLNKPDFALLDEPTNHLDSESRNILYTLIKNYKRGLLIVSHDRELLNLMDEIYELSSKGIKVYGGNYDFYEEQKQIENEAAQNNYDALNQQYSKSIKEKSIALQQQAKRSATGKKKLESGSIPRIAKKKLQDTSMKTISRLKNSHSQKIDQIKNKLTEAKEELENSNNIIIDVNAARVHSKKMILDVNGVNYKFPDSENNLWKEEIGFSLFGNERWSISGVNGSGKTILLKLIMNELIPSTGEIKLFDGKAAFLDQNVHIFNEELSILENLKIHSDNKIPEHELRIKLGRFLFYGEDAFKKVKDLSGGEKMRAGLACILSSGKNPELLILDEPSNSLDLKSLKELSSALNKYTGALIVVSHDRRFLSEINIEKELQISAGESHKISVYKS